MKGHDIIRPSWILTERKIYNYFSILLTLVRNIGINILNPHSKMAAKLPKQGVKYKQSRGRLFHSS